MSALPGGLRPLRDVRTTDAAEVGGKAASLGDLIGAGVRVPDGVVLPTTFVEFPATERHAILVSASDMLGGGPFAVRSSGISEDGAERSFAGIYESVLGVAAADLEAATGRVVESARSSRVAAYGSPGGGHLAVVIQRMVEAVASGVVLTADPISGDRSLCTVTAVLGVGERLVSGAANGDWWEIRDRKAMARRTPEQAIDRAQVLQVAAEARRIASMRGTPQDIEWAIDANGSLWILQARPMTALPPDVSWRSPARGAYTRSMRFGEWIHEPVTPLFESWLLTTMEERLHQLNRIWVGQIAPRPYHVVVNGWYFYSINFLSGGALLRSLPGIVRQLFRDRRRVGVALPQTVRSSIPVYEREWREDLLPRYRSATADAEQRVESTSVHELPALIDELAELAGEYFASIAVVGGSAYKMEMNLARFYGRYLRRELGGSHLPLLVGFQPPRDPGRHAVVSLDWWHALPDAAPMPRSESGHDRLVASRKAAEAAAFAALASSPRRLRAFKDLLAETQRLVPIREEQVGELTIVWPTMRRALLRIGENLVARGVIADPDDVYFLTRDEVLSALHGEPAGPTVDVRRRRAERLEQVRLVPPLVVGRLNPLLRSLWAAFPRVLGARRSDTALVSGSPASPGRATGRVRVIRNADQFPELEAGEVLVAPLTAPAWTPLFARASAVVTDNGSPASHASIIAREYGIPAVVGCGDATARLRTGMRVMVDGATGNVESA